MKIRVLISLTFVHFSVGVSVKFANGWHTKATLVHEAQKMSEKDLVVTKQSRLFLDDFGGN